MPKVRHKPSNKGSPIIAASKVMRAAVRIATNADWSVIYRPPDRFAGPYRRVPIEHCADTRQECWDLRGEAPPVRPPVFSLAPLPPAPSGFRFPRRGGIAPRVDRRRLEPG